MMKFILNLMIGVLLFSAPAFAQFIPNQNKSRAVCDSIKSLEALTGGLSKPSDIEDVKYEPRSTGCVWLTGTARFTRAEIGDPVGWLYSGRYIIAVHTFSLASGSGVVHASVVVPRDQWRFADNCDVSPWKVQLATGEGYRFFGRNRTGVLEHCKLLVNRQQEANELNKPIVSYSPHWKSRPESRHLNTCTRFDGLTAGLDAVVNEQQINNSSTDVFPRKGGCLQRGIEQIIAARFLGLYLSNEYAAKNRFWFEIYQVAYLNPETQTVTMAYMPVRPVRFKFLKMNESCLNARSSVRTPTGTISLSGAILGDVPGTIIRVGGRAYEIADMNAVLIGRQDCFIGRTWST